MGFALDGLMTRGDMLIKFLRRKRVGLSDAQLAAFLQERERDRKFVLGQPHLPGLDWPAARCARCVRGGN